METDDELDEILVTFQQADLHPIRISKFGLISKDIFQDDESEDVGQ